MYSDYYSCLQRFPKLQERGSPTSPCIGDSGSGIFKFVGVSNEL